jgi:A/G-specific adenine glycosylase
VPTTPSLPPEARDAILAWYAANGRRLAFRGTSDPYAILVSEVIAQQTQAPRAAEHWQRFIARFPTVAALAAAGPADVQRAWRGLGYNRRALAIWRAARTIESEHVGTVPDSVEALETLPGVGPYTARAVAAIAFGRRVGAVDVNVRRVIGRMVASDHSPIGAAEMQRLADRAVPQGRPDEWTHAVMDLGALLCRPRDPRCSECPANPWCRFAAGDRLERKVPVDVDRARRANPSFPSTTRWLRGRILDRLRAAPGSSWVTIDAPIGSHDAPRIRKAAESMAAEGLIEIDSSVSRSSREPVRARLATN